MKIFGLQITRAKAAVEGMTVANSGGAFSGGWFGVVREAFAGAFQSNVEVDSSQNILAFSAVFSCVTLIASDIAKLCIALVQENEDGICVPAKPNSPYWAVLRKPNHFQNRIKFIEQWIISKLLYGNTYALKKRDNRGIVVDLYILDARRVTPLVTPTGDVYYRLSADHLSGLEAQITVPASEIIHDMMSSLWHPLIGVSPIFACGMSATMGNKIQANSTKFFANASRPSGALSAPGQISDATAKRLKDAWEENYGGSNIGRLAVLGDGLKYEAMTIPAVDAQMIQQLDWTVQDVARAFHMPLFKIGAESGKNAGNLSVESQQQLYLNDCLHILIESLELCLEEGLGLPYGYHAEMDEEGLLRMDTAARYEAKSKAVNGGWLSPNEARRSEDLKPVAGGESPYLQQQNYSLAALAKRDMQADPFGTAKPPALPAPAQAENDAVMAEQAAKQAKELMEYISKGLACST